MNQNQHQSLAGPGPAPQGSAPSLGLDAGQDISVGERVSVSWPNSSAHTRRVTDLFQPVTSPEPVAALPVQPLAPLDGPEQDGELVSVPAPQSGDASGAPKWAHRGYGLVTGMPGSVIALVASAALVLVLAGVTMFPASSSSAQSSVAALKPDRLPAPETPVISDAPPATVPAVEAPATPAGPVPAEASSPDKSAAMPAHQQLVPAAHHPVSVHPVSAHPRSARPVQTSPAPDHRPVSPPPSTATTGDTGSRTVTTGSHTGHKGPTHWNPPPRTDRQRELRTQRDEWREAARDYRASREERSGRSARPDATSRHRSSPEHPRCPGPASTPSSRGCVSRGA